MILAGGNTSWRCVKRNCPGRIIVNEIDNVVTSSEHNHEPESGGNESKQFVSEIHHRAVEKKIIPRNTATLRSSV